VIVFVRVYSPAVVAFAAVVGARALDPGRPRCGRVAGNRFEG
jgi:hypothetical protein